MSSSWLCHVASSIAIIHLHHRSPPTHPTISPRGVQGFKFKLVSFSHPQCPSDEFVPRPPTNPPHLLIWPETGSRTEHGVVSILLLHYDLRPFYDRGCKVRQVFDDRDRDCPKCKHYRLRVQESRRRRIAAEALVPTEKNEEILTTNYDACQPFMSAVFERVKG